MQNFSTLFNEVSKRFADIKIRMEYALIEKQKKEGKDENDKKFTDFLSLIDIEKLENLLKINILKTKSGTELYNEIKTEGFLDEKEEKDNEVKSEAYMEEESFFDIIERVKREVDFF